MANVIQNFNNKSKLESIIDEDYRNNKITVIDCEDKYKAINLFKKLYKLNYTWFTQAPLFILKDTVLIEQTIWKEYRRCYSIYKKEKIVRNNGYIWYGERCDRFEIHDYSEIIE